MHFQSATPCVRHDHALSARGGDFIAWSLSLTGLVNAYWPDWHTSSRKLTKWCLTDNLAQFENCHHSHRRKLFLFLHDGPHSFINKNYSFLLIHCLFVFRFLFHFVNLFLTGCDWQGAFSGTRVRPQAMHLPEFLTKPEIIGLASSPRDSKVKKFWIHFSS